MKSDNTMKMTTESSFGNFQRQLLLFRRIFVFFCKFLFLGIHYLSCSCQKKQRLISCNHKALTTFHHDAPNSLAPGFKFLEFFVNDLSTRTRGEYSKNTRHTASTENSLNLIPSNSLMLDLVTDNSWIKIPIKIPIQKCIISKLFKEFLK